MNGNLWKIALSLLLRRRRALLLLIAGIILSVSLVCTMVVSTMSLVATMTEQWNQMLGAQDAILLRVDKEELQQAVSHYQLSSLFRIDLVGAVLTDDLQQVDDKAIVIGSLDQETAQIIRVLPEEGRLPEISGEIALERNTLLRLNRQGELGDKVTFAVSTITADGFSPPGRESTYTVVGILPNRSRLRNDHLGGGQTGVGWPNAYISAADATVATVCHGIISDPSVFDQESASPLQQALTELTENSAHDGLFTSGPGQSFPIIDQLSGLKPKAGGGYASEGNPAAIFLIVPLVMILMLACGISGAFAADLRGRRRQLALMRAIGATRKQVIQMTLEQAVMVFLLAAPAGVLLSLLLTGSMLRIVGTALGMPVLLWRSWTMVLGALILSLLVSLASALAPALRLTRLAPVQAVTQQQMSGYRRAVARKLPVYTRRISLRLSGRQLKSHLVSLMAGALVTGLCIAACSAVWTFSISYAKHNWLPESDYWLSTDIIRYPTGSVAGLIVSTYQESSLEKADFTEMAVLPGVEQCRVTAYIWDTILLLDPEKDSHYVRQMIDYASKTRGDHGRQTDQTTQTAQAFLELSEDILIAVIDILAIDDASLQMLIESAQVSATADLNAMRRGDAVLACLPPTVFQVITQTTEHGTEQRIYYGSDPEQGEPVDNTTLTAGDLLRLVKLYEPAEQLSGSRSPTDATRRELTPVLTGLLEPSDVWPLSKISRPTLILHLDALNIWGASPESQTVELMAAPEADNLWLEQELELRFGDKAHIVSRREQEQSNRQFALLVSIIGFSILGFIILLTTLATLNQNAVRRQSRRRDNAILRALGLQASTLSRIQLADGLLQVLLATLAGIAGTVIIQKHLFTPALMGSNFNEPIPWALVIAIAGGLCLVTGLDTFLGIRAQRREGLIEQIRQLD